MAPKQLFRTQGLLALHHLCFIIAGEVANAWATSGSLGPILTSLARIMGVSVARNAETDYTYEKA